MILFRIITLGCALALLTVAAPAQQAQPKPESPAPESPLQALVLPDDPSPQTAKQKPALDIEPPARVAAPTPVPRAARPAAPEATNPDPSALVGLTELPESITPALPPIEGKGVDDNLLPLRLPGYELRVLDKRKKMLYNIKGSWVEASLPVYFYYPTEPASKDKALQLLRKVYDDVLALGEKPQWTAAEFRNVLVSLDAALSILETGNNDNKQAAATRK